MLLVRHRITLTHEGFLKTVSRHSTADIHNSPEMTDLVRSRDWSKTVLGAAENWPPSLTLIVKVMLASGFPMCVRWGPKFVMIYNDGYRSILGDRHPAAFGLPFHEAWPEVQSQLRPLHEAILNGTSGAFFAEDLLIKVQRRGTSDWEDARFTLSYSPVPDDTAPTGVGGVLVTVVETTNRVRTEEALRASEEQQGLLVRELNHRIKNLFAITGGMIALSARSATTPKEYANNIRGRLNALAVAHDLILPTAGGDGGTQAEPTGLEILLRRILSPYVEVPSDNSGARLILDGPPVPLGARAVTTFALILHELATNAAKYGALSVGEGTLRITWTSMDGVLKLKWEESGGPALSGPPKSEGFGTVISNHSVREQFGGTLSHNWDSKGLSVKLTVPMKRLSH